ncbi:MAG: membrane protein insertase YidC [Lentisphaerota bacterium]
MFKNLDRSSIIIVVLCLILIFSWNYIFGPSGLNLLPTPKQETTKQVDTIPVAKEQSLASKSISKNTPSKEPSLDLPLTQMAQTATTFPEEILTSPDKLMNISFNPNLGCISAVTLNSIIDASGKNVIVLNKAVKPGALAVSEANNAWTIEKIYQPIINKTDYSLSLKRKMKSIDGDMFVLEQNWKLDKQYVTDYSITIYNQTQKNLKFNQLFVWAGGIPPIEYVSGDIARSESHMVDVLLSDKNEVRSFKVEDKNFSTQAGQTDPVRWVAISDKYFADILKPLSNDGNFYGGNYNARQEETTIINKAEKNFFVGSSAGIIKNVNIAAQSSSTWNFKYYSGPKDIKLLAAFAPKAQDIMHLAFTGIETIAQWLLYFLIFLHGYVGNYGWAIILLTVIVKLVFWPITHKSNVSMKKMQKIQPAIKELREKYKEDKPKLNTKMMELYKKEGVNPLGGCLPIVVQIPVFFALYWTLDGAIELRHQAFLWATDLTQPDTIAHIFSIPINPLAILMALTMVLQQKLTPVATDPMQAKMMMFMPLIMLIFLYSLPSGLTLYWTVSQVISIIQLMVNIYNDKKEKAKTNPKTA